MKLKTLAAKPKLIKITIDDQDIVDEFGDIIEFYTWDRQPMNTFIKLAGVDTGDYSSVMEAVKDLILDEDAKPIITEENILPAKVMMRCITKLVEDLGKF